MQISNTAIYKRGHKMWGIILQISRSAHSTYNTEKIEPKNDALLLNFYCPKIADLQPVDVYGL